MVGIMIRRKRAGFFCWLLFDGNGDNSGGICVSLLVGGIMTDSEIDSMQLNTTSRVSCKE